MMPAFEELVQQNKLGHLLGELQAVARPALCLRAAAAKDLPVGCSRTGGLPDLPPGTPWPVRDGVLLEFLMQIHCEDLVEVDLEKSLPPAGLLSFFFDGMLTGYNTGQGMDRCAVIFTPPGVELTPLQPPADAPELFMVYDPPCRLGFERALTLPPLCEVYDGDMIPMVTPLPFKSGDAARYLKLVKALNPRGSWLLGHPVPIQGGELRLDLVVHHGAGRYKYKDYHWVHEKELTQKMSALSLLFQAASDPARGLNFGDAGRVYFWINRADLEKGCFDNVRAILQSG